jgi:Leucine-rich repeat (LRR) protein
MNKLLNSKYYKIFILIFIIAFVTDTILTFAYPGYWKNRALISNDDNIVNNNNELVPNRTVLDKETINKVVTFKDKNFELIVRNKIKKEDSDITYNDLVDIEELNISHQNITNLDGIECFVNLAKLDISYNNITDINKISGLKNLKELNLYNNKILNINSLENLKDLTKIDLSFNKLNNVDSLKNLTNLEYLDLSFNNIDDIKPLENLKKLKMLDVSKNNLDITNSNNEFSYINEFYNWGNKYKGEN